jgi:hypothetical protein
MHMNVAKEVAALEALTVAELRVRYAEVFGEETRVGHKTWLVRRIAWRLQALSEGDLSERARRRAAELANDADVGNFLIESDSRETKLRNTWAVLGHRVPGYANCNEEGFIRSATNVRNRNACKVGHFG